MKRLIIGAILAIVCLANCTGAPLLADQAVFRTKGDYPQCLIDTWGDIWQSDLPRTYSGDYEVYEQKFVTDGAKEVDIFVAIEKK